jgi:hypothetical protein
MHRELAELHAIRLDEGLSFRALAQRVGVSHTVLYKALHRITEPSELNRHRMQRFLKSRKSAKRRAS